MKQHAIRTVYVVHHSHTDIGYTDLQEHVVDLQVDYIRSALRLMQDPANADFRWNCETLFCVEEFFKTATEEEKAQFMALAKDGRLGLSANYLNFTDLWTAASMPAVWAGGGRSSLPRASTSTPPCVPTSTASPWVSGTP